MTQWEEESTDEHSLTLTACNRLEECTGPPTQWHQCSYESINTIVTADLLSEAAGADRRRLAVYDAIDELTTLLETCMDP